MTHQYCPTCGHKGKHKKHEDKCQYCGNPMIIGTPVTLSALPTPAISPSAGNCPGPSTGMPAAPAGLAGPIT